MIKDKATGILRQEGAAFHGLVKEEIQSLRREQKTLLNQGRAGYATILVLLCAIAINAILFVSFPDFPVLFIAASIYLQMFYFLTLLIPVGGGSAKFPKEEIKKIFSTVYRTGIIPTTDRFTRIFLDVFFINSRTLAPGFLCIFSVDVLFIITGYSSGVLSGTVATLIFIQVLAIVLFYLLLMRLEPGTARFKTGVSGMKGHLASKYPSWLVIVLFGTAALLVLLVILSTIILLPGITVNALTSLSGLEDVTNLFLVIAIIAVSQYFIVRFFHGMASARMVTALAESRILMLQAAGGEETAGDTEGSEPSEIAAGVLLESKIYRVGIKTICGLFPVYLIDLDFSVLFDQNVMGVITGYLKSLGSADLAQP